MLSLTVTAIRAEARDVISYELRHRLGDSLPSWSPGSHLELDIPQADGQRPLVRHYSLANDWRDSDRYEIAVARAPSGRGGSAAMHDLVRVGSVLSGRGPRNNFPLDPDAGFYRFIAGGIGITPILSMIRWCVANDKPWSLLYGARSQHRAPYYEVLRSFADRVGYHFDDEGASPTPDLAAALASPVAGEHVYCCGPSPMMRAVEELCADRDPASVRLERFTADPVASSAATAGEFELVLRRSGTRLTVPADRSVLEVLEVHGVRVANSCREGVCASCETRVLSGEVDHRDHVLTKAERSANRTMMVCVSRSAGGPLELDV